MPLKVCHNCFHKLSLDDTYCARCGQKYKSSIPNFWEIISEAFQSVFGLDNRLFRTLTYLFAPGQLPQIYMSGQRKRVIGPGQLFIGICVLFYALLSFKTGDIDDLSVDEDYKSAKTYYESIQFIKNHKKSSLTESEAEHIDSAYAILVNYHDTSDDSTTIYKWFDQPLPAISYKDLINKSEEELITQMDPNLNQFEQFIVKRQLKFEKSGSDIIQNLLYKSYWAVLISIPLLALVLKLLYLRRNKYFAEHVTFLLYVHATCFAIATIYVFVLGQETDNILWLVGACVLFLILSQRVFYKQGTLKSLVKIGLFAAFYPFVFALSITILFGIAFLVF